METERVIIDRGKALELYRAYKKHAHYSKPIDQEIQRAYQLIAQGRLIIKALESVKAAGLKAAPAPDAGFPKLALCRADALSCSVYMQDTGECRMLADDASQYGRTNSRSRIMWPRGSFPHFRERPWRATALMPTPPLHLRPKRGLANYHVLWEAEWTKIAPHDPMLLRRIGKADLWVVVAMWDLTEVERAALSTRI